MTESNIKLILSQFKTTILFLSIGLSHVVYSLFPDISSDPNKINSQKILLQLETLTGAESIRTTHTHQTQLLDFLSLLKTNTT